MIQSGFGRSSLMLGPSIANSLTNSDCFNFGPWHYPQRKDLAWWLFGSASPVWALLVAAPAIAMADYRPPQEAVGYSAYCLQHSLVENWIDLVHASSWSSPRVLIWLSVKFKLMLVRYCNFHEWLVHLISEVQETFIS